MDIPVVMDLDECIPGTATANHQPSVHCCCNNNDCAFRSHASASLTDMQNNVRAAALAGQALLVRHEAYVTDSERERTRLSINVANLEQSNMSLEARNENLIGENHALNAQIRDLGGGIAQAESKIQILTTNLHRTQTDVQRLAALALRAEHLDTQLIQLESDQARLQETLARTVDEEREVRQKWLACQRRAIELQEQMESIEKAARDERRQHLQVVAQMKRTKFAEVEAQNELAARMVSDKVPGNGSVVSSFVKNVLRDNASMQLSMVEMQKLLAEAEEELDTLRQSDPPALSAVHSQTLDEELTPRVDTRDSRELHVHHHYHAPGKQRSALRTKTPVLRPRKKRPNAGSSGYSTPTSVSSLSTSPRKGMLGRSVSSDGPIQQTLKRWSSTSNQTRSSTSYASPPPSTIFEVGLDDAGNEFSRPTSPDSNGVGSPIFTPPENMHSVLMKDVPEPLKHFTTQRQISPQQNLRNSEPFRKANDVGKTVQSPQRLHRTASHASLLSISGMDIHTSLPELTFKERGGLRLFHRQPSLATVALSGAAVASTTTSASQIESLKSTSSSSWSKLRDNLDATDAPVPREQYDIVRDTLSKPFGGWLSSRWKAPEGNQDTTIDGANEQDAKPSEPRLSKSGGPLAMVPEALYPDIGLRSSSESVQTAPRLIPSAPRRQREYFGSPTKSLSPRYRFPGVNQTGGLPPLPMRRSAKVLVTAALDEAALRECLEGIEGS